MQHELKQRIEEREYVLNRIKELLISSLRLDLSRDDLDPDTPLFGAGLGLDSIDAVVIIVELESEFGFILTNEENMLALRTINSVVDVVLSKKNYESSSQI